MPTRAAGMASMRSRTSGIEKSRSRASRLIRSDMVYPSFCEFRDLQGKSRPLRGGECVERDVADLAEPVLDRVDLSLDVVPSLTQIIDPRAQAVDAQLAPRLERINRP